MKNGFLRGIFIGSVMGAAATMLIKPETRERAKEVLNQGSQLLKGAEENLVNTTNWIEKSRHLFQDDEPLEEAGLDGSKENIDNRVAFLERRLEELEHRGV